MERNRMKAVSLKRSRLTARAEKRPHDLKAADGEDGAAGGSPPRWKPPKEKKLVDTKSGFFIEVDEEGGETGEGEEVRNLVSLPAPITKPDRPECEECGEAVAESFLLRTFDVSVCDSCKGRTDRPLNVPDVSENKHLTFQDMAKISTPKSKFTLQ